MFEPELDVRVSVVNCVVPELLFCVVPSALLEFWVFIELLTALEVVPDVWLFVSDSPDAVVFVALWLLTVLSMLVEVVPEVWLFARESLEALVFVPV